MMGPLTMEQTKKQLRAVLLSRKRGVALDQLEIEYFNLVRNVNSIHYPIHPSIPSIYFTFILKIL